MSKMFIRCRCGINMVVVSQFLRSYVPVAVLGDGQIEVRKGG